MFKRPRLTLLSMCNNADNNARDFSKPDISGAEIALYRFIKSNINI